MGFFSKQIMSDSLLFSYKCTSFSSLFTVKVETEVVFTNVLAITSFIFVLHHFFYLCITEGPRRVNVTTQCAISWKDLQEMLLFFYLISFCVLSELTIMFIN